jgi:hypothetical protein
MNLMVFRCTKTMPKLHDLHPDIKKSDSERQLKPYFCSWRRFGTTLLATIGLNSASVGVFTFAGLTWERNGRSYQDERSPLVWEACFITGACLRQASTAKPWGESRIAESAAGKAGTAGWTGFRECHRRRKSWRDR